MSIWLLLCFNAGWKSVLCVTIFCHLKKLLFLIILFLIILMNGWRKILNMLPYNKFPSETLGLHSSWFAGIALYISRTSRIRLLELCPSKKKVMFSVSRAQMLPEMALCWALGCWMLPDGNLLGGKGHADGQCGASIRRCAHTIFSIQIQPGN